MIVAIEEIPHQQIGGALLVAQGCARAHGLNRTAKPVSSLTLMPAVCTLLNRVEANEAQQEQIPFQVRCDNHYSHAEPTLFTSRFLCLLSDSPSVSPKSW
jgi:hypothetical protein